MYRELNCFMFNKQTKLHGYTPLNVLTKNYSYISYFFFALNITSTKLSLFKFNIQVVFQIYLSKFS